MPRKKVESFDFEKSLDKLNQLVEKMERGDLPLEQSLKYFEEGVALINGCQKTLAQAEQKVHVLTKHQGQETLKPHQPEGNNDD